MIFSLDIDGVLARMHTQVYIHACNERFEFGLSSEELATLTYRAFLEHPCVQAYRDQVGEEAAHTALRWMYYRPDVLSQAKRHKGSLAGVERCAGIAAEVYYVTCRYASHSAANRGIQSATREWLATQGFPCAEQIIFCQNYQEKMGQLAQLCQRNGVVHVDDNWRDLQGLLSDMPPGFTLIAFGAQAAEDCAASVLPLPSWKQLENVLEQLERRESYVQSAKE